MLPPLIEGICLSPFQNGRESPQRYLVEAGARSFVVNLQTLALIEALQLTHEPAAVTAYIHTRTNEVVSESELHASIARLPLALFNQGIASEHKTPIRWRFSVIPARAVRLIAARTSGLFSPQFLMASVIALATVAPFACMAARDGVQQTKMAWGTLGVFGLGFVVSAIVHELGHASAVARNGLAAGHIGFGLYWFYPVFYTDVNVAWKLPPSRRVMVDLGGVYFQLLLVAGMTPLAFFGPVVEAVRLLILLNLYSVLQNLNPFFKMDGYWILADIAQIPNLHGKAFDFWRSAFTRHTAAPRTRFVLVLYGLAVGLYIGYVFALLPGIIRVQLLPRLSSAGVGLALFAESCRKTEWSAALGHLGFALQASLVPVVAMLTLTLWLVSLRLRRRPKVTAQNP